MKVRSPLFAVGRPLRRLVSLAAARPALTVSAWAIVAAAMLACSLVALRFETSTLKLLSPHAGFVQRYREYARNFGEVDDVIVVVASPEPARSAAFAQALVERLRRGPVRFRRLAYRVDPEGFAGQSLLYLDVDELRDLRGTLIEHRDFLDTFASEPGIERLLAGLRRRLDAGILGAMFDLGLGDRDATGHDLDVLRDVVHQLRAAVDGHGGYRSPWAGLFGGLRGEDEGLFLSDDKRLLFVFAEPIRESEGFTGDRDAVTGIRRAIAEVRPGFPGVEAGVTGGPALDSDEMATAFADSELATALAAALTLGVLFLAFRRVAKPLLMLAILGVSLIVSLGVVTLTIGHLTIFSVMFISMVLGLGIDYGIYVLFRYEAERETLAPREALAVTAEQSGPGIVLGALGAAVTFYVLTLTRFRGIQEFGFVAGTALLVAAAAMLTLLPAVLVLLDARRAPRAARAARADRESRVLAHVAGRPRLVLGAAVAVSLLAAWGAARTTFDYDLTNLQARGTESVQWERRIAASATRSVYGALDAAGSLEELRVKEAAYRRLPSVADVDSVTMLIPERQEEKIALLAGMGPLLAHVRVGPRVKARLDRVRAEATTLAGRLAFVADQAPAGPTRDELRRVQRDAEGLRATLATGDRAALARRLDRFDARLHADFQHVLASLRAGFRATPVTPQNVPEELRRKFVGEDGRFLIEIHPRVNIWERAGAARFVEELRTVTPDVTGSPVVTYEAIRLMESAYREGVVYAFVFVTALTLWILGRRRYAMLGLVPFVLGALWAVGLMPLLGLRFNLSNVWGLPLIIGASAEYGLNLVMRFVEARAEGGPRFPRSTVAAVVLNGVTTIVGFGSLLVAHHRGIWSLGLLLTVGTCTSLAASLLVLPALLRRFDVGAPRAAS